MKVTTRELGNREVELNIEVGAERVDSAMRAVARRYAREIKMPGFRPGKAPYSVVVQRVGADRLLQDALDEIAPGVYEDAMREAGLQPYDLRPLQISSYDPLTLTTTIPLMPHAELGDYRAVQVDSPSAEVGEEQIDAILREYQEEYAQLVPVDRGAGLDDQIIANLKIEADGSTIYERENISFVLSPDGLTGVPRGFSAQLVGAIAGEERQFTLTYPEDLADEELAGQPATFTVVVQEVKERELPALDDDLAQTVGDFETLHHLRERTRAVLLARAEMEVRSQLMETVISQVVEMAVVEFPPVALEDELNRLIADVEAQAKDQGLTLDNYLLMQGLTRGQLREEKRAEAERRLKRRIVLTEVVRREGIEVSDAEVEREIETIAELYGPQAAAARASLSSQESRQSLHSRLLAQKAIDRLIQLATRQDDGRVPDGSAAASEAGPEAPLAPPAATYDNG